MNEARDPIREAHAAANHMTSYDTMDDLEAELARARFDLERSLIGADNARIRIRDLEADIRDYKKALDPQQEAAREDTHGSDRDRSDSSTRKPSQ